MKLFYVYAFIVVCAVLHLADCSIPTTITPLRFFLRNLFKKRIRSSQVMESGIVEPTDIEELSKSFSGRSQTTAKPLDISDFLSPMTRSDDDDDSVKKKKPKGFFSLLFKPKGKDKEKDKEHNDGLFNDVPFLSNALRAIRISGQQTLRSILKGVLPSLFSS